MSLYINQQEAPVTAYPAEGQGQGQVKPPAPYVAAPPPPVGYPTKDGPAGYPQQSVPVKTTSRGDGFWKGCCAGLCCCCAIEECCL